MKDKAVAIGLGAGVLAFVATLLFFGMIEEDGMRMRVNWVVGGLYLFGGKAAVAAFMGVAAGFTGWLFAS
jgi:hypothetical protein